MTNNTKNFSDSVSDSDRALGMDRKIDRRDFLNGASISVVGAMLSPALIKAAQADEKYIQRQDKPGYYPPALDGLRGSHTGSFEAAHTVRDGENWQADDTGQEYDLVVVGGGISGLAAAYFFRQTAGPEAKILILDNHDDFGGHAKRNEYDYKGRNILVNGGTLNVEGSSRYSTMAMGLLRDIGIDTDAYQEKTKDMIHYHRDKGLDGATYFDKETFGAEGLVGKPSFMSWGDFIDQTPLSDKVKTDLKFLYNEESKIDYFQGLSDEDKKAKLAAISYNDYLLNYAKVDEDVLPFFQASTHFRFYVGPEQVPALFCWEINMPGFGCLNLRPTTKVGPLQHMPGSQHGREHESREESIYFPDGNATITRMIVRGLIADAVPGTSLDDVFTARVNYNLLDRPNNPSRIRLNSTVINVEHLGDADTAKQVEVSYIQDGIPSKVRAKNTILACWHTVIPYICKGLPQPQKEALSYGIKAPRIYTNVLLNNGHAFAKLGVYRINAPGCYHTTASLHPPISVGDYKAPFRPEDPVIVKMHKAPNMPGLPRRDQLRAGRLELFNTPFETFERNIRQQLTEMLAPGGFDAARDIEAITVNRWPHGNAYAYDTLTDPVHWAMFASDDRPCVIARKSFGRISIANSDAAASPFTDAAIDEAHRAVREVLFDRSIHK